MGANKFILKGIIGRNDATVLEAFVTLRARCLLCIRHNRWTVSIWWSHISSSILKALLTLLEAVDKISSELLGRFRLDWRGYGCQTGHICCIRLCSLWMAGQCMVGSTPYILLVLVEHCWTMTRRERVVLSSRVFDS